MNDLLELLLTTRAALTAQIGAAYDNDDLALQDTLCNARIAIDAITDDLQAI
tara:strand:+ start:1153 stop:1308 length:156 start_codon:yes stop_codon:yes gene_type:complete